MAIGWVRGRARSSPLAIRPETSRPGCPVRSSRPDSPTSPPGDQALRRRLRHGDGGDAIAVLRESSPEGVDVVLSCQNGVQRSAVCRLPLWPGSGCHLQRGRRCDRFAASRLRERVGPTKLCEAWQRRVSIARYSRDIWTSCCCRRWTPGRPMGMASSQRSAGAAPKRSISPRAPSIRRCIASKRTVSSRAGGRWSRGDAGVSTVSRGAGAERSLRNWRVGGASRAG